MKRAACFLCACLLLFAIARADVLPGGEREAPRYATQFELEHGGDGCTLVTLAGEDRFLIVPEDGAVPEGLPEDVVVLKQPLDHIYLAATSAMDLISALGGVDSVTLSGTQESGWYIPAAVEAMRRGRMRYAGKYSAPDFEMLLEDGCQLAVESTMIYHTPEVKEQIEALGVPVLVEHSSYESHPLGRMEWVRLYGALLGKEAEAERVFSEQMAALETVLAAEKTGRTVAFFSVNAMGLINVRKSGDYIVKVIELAGGEYALRSLDETDNALSTMNIQMEDFYAGARDADFLIYNSAIEGELESLSQLTAKNDLFSSFKAVENGRVYCTGRNLFQETMGLGRLILDIHEILTVDDPDAQRLTYLHRLKQDE